jgi:hypothetical protein
LLRRRIAKAWQGSFGHFTRHVGKLEQADLSQVSAKYQPCDHLPMEGAHLALEEVNMAG